MDKKPTDNLSNNSPILSNGLSDNEIVKALEYCTQQGITSECERCEVKKGCRSELIVNALDIINRLQAENERLKKSNEMFTDIGKLYSEIKAEAYKEFAERLKDIIADHLDQSLDNPGGNNYFITDVYTDIDNLLKEKERDK